MKSLNEQISCFWYVIYTLPKFEKKIHQKMTALGITSFLPLQQKLSQWTDRKKKLEVPLFPSYLFVQIKEQERFKVLTVPGVVNFVCFEGKPAIIQEDIIDKIKKVLDHSPEVFHGEDLISKGERVRVLQGPFSNLEGIAVDVHGKKRLIIMLEALEKIVSVDVSNCSLEVVK